MKDTLKSLYLAIDTNIQVLSDKARAQLILKILFSEPQRISKSQIFDRLKSVFGVKSIDYQRFDTIIENLCGENQIHRNSGSYYLSSNMRNRINSELQNSEALLQRIVENYFSPTYSNEIVIKEWLSDVTIHFFAIYSDLWMADLGYKDKLYTQNKDSIIETIKRRTDQNKTIDKRDRENIANKFYDFIRTSSPDTNQFISEYGFSSFAAKMVKETTGVDNLTISVFKNTHCILDTNVLIDIALDTNDNIKALVETFQFLNINACILPITEEEYTTKISSVYNNVSPLLKGNFPKVLPKANGQFMKAARQMHCSTSDDFRIFFESIKDVPGSIDEEYKLVPIGVNLDSISEDARKNKELISAYDSHCKERFRKEKKHHALIHDVVMMECAKHLRGSEPYFILSNDDTIKSFAKSIPIEHNLPIAIGLDTLINLFAIERGGITTSNISFYDLFANIVRQGLKPAMNTFCIEDIAYVFDKNQQIADLSPEQIIGITQVVIKQRVEDVPEQEIHLSIMRAVQGDKMQIVDDYDKLKHKFNVESSKSQQQQEQINRLKESIRKQAERSYKNKRSQKFVTYLLFLPIIVSLIVVAIYYAVYANKPTENEITFWSWLIDNIAPLIVTALITSLCGGWLKVWKFIRNKEKYINDYLKDNFEEQ